MHLLKHCNNDQHIFKFLVSLIIIFEYEKYVIRSYSWKIFSINVFLRSDLLFWFLLFIIIFPISNILSTVDNDDDVDFDDDDAWSD